MMYKDLEEEKLPTAHDTFIKHFNFDKSGLVEAQDQCILNAMEEYALVKTKKLREKVGELELQISTNFHLLSDEMIDKFYWQMKDRQVKEDAEKRMSK